MRKTLAIAQQMGAFLIIIVIAFFAVVASLTAGIFYSDTVDLLGVTSTNRTQIEEMQIQVALIQFAARSAQFDIDVFAEYEDALRIIDEDILPPFEPAEVIETSIDPVERYASLTAIREQAVVNYEAAVSEGLTQEIIQADRDLNAALEQEAEAAISDFKFYRIATASEGWRTTQTVTLTLFVFPILILWAFYSASRIVAPVLIAADIMANIATDNYKPAQLDDLKKRGPVMRGLADELGVMAEAFTTRRQTLKEETKSLRNELYELRKSKLDIIGGSDV